MADPMRLLSPLSCLAFLFGTLPALTADDAELPEPEFRLLWPAGAPAANGNEPADQPAIWIYPPIGKPNGAAVVICPGGGYAIHATDHEGVQPARFFNRLGMTAVVLRYRLSPYRHPVPLEDAQRAIRYLRHNSEQLRIDRERIGIMGFSAGGHLTSTAVTHFDSGMLNSIDPVDRHSSRPDFGILGYPVVSFVADYSHRGSGRNLLGPDATEEQLRSLSNDLHVTGETPPVFLFHTSEDGGVPPENSLAFYAACHKAGVPAELHIYQQGPHGVGLAFGHPALENWISAAGHWLRQNGLLTAKPQLALEGTVTLNGEPLRWGSIAFRSRNAAEPVGWAMVNRGRFSIPAQNGPVAGEHEVIVTDMGQIDPLPVTADARQLPAMSLQISADQPSLELNLSIPE